VNKTSQQICYSIIWKKMSVLVTAALVLFPGVLLGQGKKTPRREASILFSDGKISEGTILLTPGVDFRLVGAANSGTFARGGKFGKVRTFNLNVVREITFSPGNEFYTKSFRFHPETKEKIYEGKPYPIREPVCTVAFNSGEKMTGTLHGVVLYLKEKDPDTGMNLRNRKFILRSKLKGKPGEKLSDVVYITRIRMLDEGDKITRSLDVKLLSLDPPSAGNLMAMTRKSLTPVPVKTDKSDGKIKVFSTFGENVFLAARIGDKYVAGWPAEGAKQTKLFKAVEKQFLKFVDYYNERKLLGILPTDGGRRILTLVSLRRQVPDTATRSYPGWFEVDGNGELMEFFRLSVWSWVRDPETGRMVLVDRGSFLRIRIDADAKTPETGICPELWPIVKKDGKILVGKTGKPVEKAGKKVEK